MPVPPPLYPSTGAFRFVGAGVIPSLRGRSMAKTIPEVWSAVDVVGQFFAKK